MSNTKKITAYDFASFCSEFQQAVTEGYQIDLNSNENYPQIIGIVFTAGLVKKQPKEVVQVEVSKEVSIAEAQVDTPKPRTSIYKPKKV